MEAVDEQANDKRAWLARNRLQEEFFDHVLRSSESYSQKWDYVKENPVRADLDKTSDEWPWQGEVELLRL